MEKGRAGPISQAPFGVDRLFRWCTVKTAWSTKAEDLLNGARRRAEASRGFEFCREPQLSVSAADGHAETLIRRRARLAFLQPGMMPGFFIESCLAPRPRWTCS